MKLRGWDNLHHMVHTCYELFEIMQDLNSVEEFVSDVKTRRAVTMCLLDLGELFKNLSDDERGEYPSENWQHLIGFRNRASHGYHQLDFKVVYSIAVNRVPPLYEFLKKKQQEQEDDGLV